VDESRVVTPRVAVASLGKPAGFMLGLFSSVSVTIMWLSSFSESELEATFRDGELHEI
jgi:hypothetical protein